MLKEENNGAEKKQETEGRRNVLMVSSTAWWVIFLFRIDEALSLLRIDFVAIFAVGFQVLIMFLFASLFLVCVSDFDHNLFHLLG